jgi:hypothetical protein
VKSKLHLFVYFCFYQDGEMGRVYEIVEVFFALFCFVFQYWESNPELDTYAVLLEQCPHPSCFYFVFDLGSP